MRYYFRQYEVTPEQSELLQSWNVPVVAEVERDDNWFWEMWS